MPHSPARTASQLFETLCPSGVTAPIPVMTTLRFAMMTPLHRHAAVDGKNLSRYV